MFKKYNKGITVTRKVLRQSGLSVSMDAFA